jgi:hypothetical protein
MKFIIGKETIFYLTSIAVFIFACSTGTLFAQPSTREIKSHLTGPKVISSVIHAPGTKVWDAAYSKYVWQIAFTNKVKDSDNPGLIIVVDGLLAFDIIGGRYVYWRSFTSRNSYLGIPDPTASEVRTLIDEFGIQRFLGVRARNIVGEVEAIGLSDEPRFEWHTPNSVFFNIDATYLERARGQTEHVTNTFRVRLYRDDLKAPWKSMVSMFLRKGAGN